MKLFSLFLITAMCHAIAADAPNIPRDGKIFDPGLTLIKRADNAPVQLDEAGFLLGQWDMTVTDHDAEGKTTTHQGHALYHMFNRGHGIMGRLFIADKGGTPWSAISMLVYSPASKSWGQGVGDSHKLAIRLHTGSMQDGKLVMMDVDRRGGGMALTWSQHTFAPKGKDGVSYTHEESNDGKSWKPIRTIDYKRRTPEAGFLSGSDGHGTPAPDRQAKADQFDFMVGEWNVNHEMTFPNGQKAKWPANGTMVHVLNGYGVMEFNWFDLDPNLPNAATTILRIYNPAQNRWESLFVTNRGNSLLFFGGAWEQDKMVLTAFDSDASAPILNHFVFHTIAKDSYHWYGENSTDGGKTYNKFWIIDGTRKSK